MAAESPCTAVLATSQVWDLLLWFGATIAAVIALGVVLLWARKYALAGLKGGAAPKGEMSIEKLEEMRDRGVISREEFSSLRKAALGLGVRAGVADPPAKGRGGGLTPPPCDVDEKEADASGQSPPAPRPE